MAKRIDKLQSGYPSLPGDPRANRRLLARTILRIAAMTAALLLLYAFTPIPGSSGVGAVVGLIVGLVVFAGLVGWQIRAIVGARHPVARAIEVISFALPLLIVVFAFTYLSLSRDERGSFSEPLDRVGAVYYTVSTTTTVGFGDITAKTDAARVIVTVQMVVDLAVLAGLVRLVLLATRAGLRGLEAGGEAGGTGTG